MAKIAILGIGVVGTGTAEVLRFNADRVSEQARENIGVKYILARGEHRDSAFRDLIVHDFSIIENDPEISVVAECIGGATAAFDYCSRALRAGKSVVTSNKELIAERGLELLALAKEKRVSLLFEAAVGGGIPIIRPIADSLNGNRIEEIYGILNGTTNYILTQMLQCAQSFDGALKSAQALGYAEADPSADVDGLDACRKICILADLAFGENVRPADVPTEGIRDISLEDARFAETMGYSIKLLGRAVRMGTGRCVYVAPHLVPSRELLANVNGVMNGVALRANAVGECFFYGPGAGKLPTASAVVSDIIDAVRRASDAKFITWGEGEAPVSPDELPSRFYVRCAKDCCAPENAQDFCEGADEIAFITPEMTPPELKALLAGTKARRVMRVLD